MYQTLPNNIVKMKYMSFLLLDPSEAFAIQVRSPALLTHRAEVLYTLDLWQTRSLSWCSSKFFTHITRGGGGV